jgi:hypothetical protein
VCEQGGDATPAQPGRNLTEPSRIGEARAESLFYGRGMKTMTCKQLGGPCDFELPGATADEVIKRQDAHLNEAVARGDQSHSDALEKMKGRWKHPLSGMKWYRNTKREFAALPED